MFFFTLIPSHTATGRSQLSLVEFLLVVSVKAGSSVLRAAHCVSLRLMNALHQQGSLKCSIVVRIISAVTFAYKNLYENGWLFHSFEDSVKVRSKSPVIFILFAFETRWRFWAV